MTLFNLIVNAETVLVTFSPVAVVEEIMRRNKGVGEIPVDIWTSEVK